MNVSTSPVRPMTIAERKRVVELIGDAEGTSRLLAS